MYRLLSPVIFDSFSEFFVPDSGSGSGGGNNVDDDDDDDDEPPAAPTTGNTVSDQIIRDYFDRTRGWMRKQRKVIARYRTRASEAERLLAAEREAITKKAVIEPADKTAYDAYKALGTPDEVKQKIADGEKAASDAANMKRDSVLREAAEAAGFNLPVLRDRVGTLEVSVREIENDGTKVPAAFVKAEDGKESPLIEYAEKNWSVYLPALVASDGTQDNGGVTRQQSTQQFPSQSSSRGASRNNTQAVSGYMGSVYKGPPKRGT